MKKLLHEQRQYVVIGLIDDGDQQFFRGPYGRKVAHVNARHIRTAHPTWQVAVCRLVQDESAP